MGSEKMILILVWVWTVVGIGLSLYLISFPIFMKKKFARVLKLLEKIAENTAKR